MDIKFNYSPSINDDFFEEVAKVKFPKCQIKRQMWGMKIPFLIIRKGFFVRANISIKHKENKGQTIVGINGSMDTLALYFFGFIFHYILRGKFLNQVKEALLEALKEKYNIMPIN